MILLAKAIVRMMQYPAESLSLIHICTARDYGLVAVDASPEEVAVSRCGGRLAAYPLAAFGTVDRALLHQAVGGCMAGRVGCGFLRFSLLVIIDNPFIYKFHNACTGYSAYHQRQGKQS